MINSEINKLLLTRTGIIDYEDIHVSKDGTVSWGNGANWYPVDFFSDPSLYVELQLKYNISVKGFYAGEQWIASTPEVTTQGLGATPMEATANLVVELFNNEK
jgi:hypothetical protein